ncbi:heat shock 70 kDa protein 12A-like [Mytilus californianus]|uniref:heat shock 70 kDa protein 12A-like n=1 Tax=Mytilus californianus TaxID=6549 RepID=UPI0022477C90|nr:heat shock 70 kDa protein 12A-like [Mytilus californianus]XP_052068181.1 heat shock 70 kDa protein 12A-like [Mytilus californianus]
MAMNSSYLLVAAIDFGTTYSGYAFSLKYAFDKDPLTIDANQAWNAGGKQLLSLKTPTCLLLDSNKHFDSFGYEAENKYAEIVMENEQDKYYYFHRFKMCLHKNKNVSREMILKDITGKSMPAIDVFALSIMALKNHLISYLVTKGTGVESRDIRWVLTVPAIWTDNAKYFMRESAEKAGIPKDNLLLALEPEAASIYCQYLPTEKFTGIEPGFTMSEPGTKYMIVDIGGGTADITVHKKLSDGCLKELCRATGGKCGGTCVDSEYIQMLISILGESLIEIFKRENPESYLDLIREFETKKRTITFSPDTKKVNMVIPMTVVNKLCKTHINKDFKSALASSQFSDSIVIRGDKVRIDTDVFKKLFDKTIADILELIQEIFKMKKANSLNQILLVGGFSTCVLVQEAVRREFSNCRVVIPFDPDLAVLKGAVLFGHKSDLISSRISKFTYEISFNPKFDSAIHDDKHRKFIDGFWRCRHAFDKIVEKDTVIRIGATIQRTYKPQKDYSKTWFKIYASENYDPVHTTEDGCFFLGKVAIDLSNSERRKGLEVEFTFGNTELGLTAIETKTGIKCNAQFALI